MSEILETIADMKGGQLKFRVDSIRYLYESRLLSPIETGGIVDIFEVDRSPAYFLFRDASIDRLIGATLAYNRPKGFGVVLWLNQDASYQVLWSPYTGDEGYFNGS